MKNILSLTGLLLIASLASAGDWPQFRGQASNGVSEDKNLPTTWSPTENIRWKAAVPGRSVASPVVVGNRVYVASASGVRHDKLSVVCFDAETGTQLWHRQMNATGNTGCHPKSSMAAPSPVANADGVFVLFATADLVSFDKDGNLRWYRSLAGDYPAIANQVGMASSPILWKNSLIVPMDSDGESFLAALDTSDGRNLWKVERPKDINWVTPALRQADGKTEILFLGRLGMTAYNAANGNKIWNYSTEGGTIATPVMMDDMVLMQGRGLVCLKPKADANPEVIWTSPKLGSGSCTPVVYKDLIYNVSGAGVMVCGDKNGKELWTERLKKGKYWASPIAGDGKIYVSNDEGIVTVMKAGDKAEVLATNDLKEEIMGTPAIANGAIYLQTVTKLYCIEAKK
ncbi:MAG: PQQ-binding-like beta-propeller repeat protein [Planctomycetes bacterium]|nr:PQQ-binding-like beta-propeller repeat protein [Planctomycetota bacterium]